MAYYNKSANGSCGNNNPRNGRMSGCGCNSAAETSMCPSRSREMAGQHAHTKTDKMPLAMAYVPWQQIGELYPPCKALSEGTAFPELNKIFCGVRG